MGTWITQAVDALPLFAGAVALHRLGPAATVPGAGLDVVISVAHLGLGRTEEDVLTHGGVDVRLVADGLTQAARAARLAGRVVERLTAAAQIAVLGRRLADRLLGVRRVADEFIEQTWTARCSHCWVQRRAATTAVFCGFLEIALAGQLQTVLARQLTASAPATGGIHFATQGAASAAGVQTAGANAYERVQAVTRPLSVFAVATGRAGRVFQHLEPIARVLVVKARLTLRAEGLARPGGAPVFIRVVRIAAEAIGAFAVVATIRRAEASIVLAQAEVCEASARDIRLAGLAQRGAIRQAQPNGVRPRALEGQALELLGAPIVASPGAELLAESSDTEARLAFIVVLAWVQELPERRVKIDIPKDVDHHVVYQVISRILHEHCVAVVDHDVAYPFDTNALWAVPIKLARRRAAIGFGAARRCQGGGEPEELTTPKSGVSRAIGWPVLIHIYAPIQFLFHESRWFRSLGDRPARPPRRRGDRGRPQRRYPSWFFVFRTAPARAPAVCVPRSGAPAR